MSTGHPTLNRGLLLGSGIASFAAGAAVLLVDARPIWAASLLAQWSCFRSDVLPRVGSWTLRLPGSTSLPGAVTVAAVVAFVVAVLLVFFLATMRRSTTGTVLRDESAQGVTTVDERVVDDVLAHTVAELPDVVSAGVRAYRLKGDTGLELTIRVRRGADLPQVITAAQAAVRNWDELAGRQPPVLIRLARRPIPGGRAAARVS